MSATGKQRKSILVRLLVLGVSVYMIFTLAGLWRSLEESKSKLHDLTEHYNAEQSDIEELKHLLEDGSQAKIIEKAARERLGYVFSDEEIYIDISGN